MTISADMERQVYSVRQLAERWGVSAAYIYSLIRRGDLDGTKFSGKLIRIRLAEIQRYEEEGPCRTTDSGSIEADTRSSGQTKAEIDSAARSASRWAKKISVSPNLHLVNLPET